MKSNLAVLRSINSQFSLATGARIGHYPILHWAQHISTTQV